MPTIMPIRDLRKTSEISELAHKKQEPIFITKNGYSDLVVMSSELYERFAQTNKIDQAIYCLLYTSPVVKIAKEKMLKVTLKQ